MYSENVFFRLKEAAMLLEEGRLKAQSFTIVLKGKIGHTNLSFKIVQMGVILGIHQLCPELLDSTFEVFNVMMHSKFHARFVLEKRSRAARVRKHVNVHPSAARRAARPLDRRIQAGVSCKEKPVDWLSE
jgi:hypothetical protein